MAAQVQIATRVVLHSAPQLHQSVRGSDHRLGDRRRTHVKPGHSGSQGMHLDLADLQLSPGVVPGAADQAVRLQRPRGPGQVFDADQAFVPAPFGSQEAAYGLGGHDLGWHTGWVEYCDHQRGPAGQSCWIALFGPIQRNGPSCN